MAGLGWGILVLALHVKIASWLGLPESVVLFQAGANLTYAMYSGNLALKNTRTDFSLKFLVNANMFYALICLGILGYFYPGMTSFGRVFLVLEAGALAALALFEKKVFFG